MLARYTMVRGAPASKLPKGIRNDTRKHTRHVLRPTEELVDSIGPAAEESAWRAFAHEYRALLARRFAEDRAPFDALAALAREHDVYIGCSCPSAKNPDVRRCHTAYALAFMKKHYPDLDVRLVER
jgi:hypothetical protein